MLPVVPPLPICSVPLLIVVAPVVGVGAGEDAVPLPAWVSVPVPLTTPP